MKIYENKYIVHINLQNAIKTRAKTYLRYFETAVNFKTNVTSF